MTDKDPLMEAIEAVSDEMDVEAASFEEDPDEAREFTARVLDRLKEQGWL